MKRMKLELFRLSDHQSSSMSFDFDTIIPRRGTGNIKYDRRMDLDPFWVADMDFASAPCILEALHQRVDHGIFGYAMAHQGLDEAIRRYLLSRHGYDAQIDEILHLGGLVPALSLAARTFCKPGEAVMTCIPVYPPFIGVHHDADATLITVEHMKIDGEWSFDWEAMERAVTPKTRVFIFCNPQNPTGRVFPQADVLKLAEFCERHNLIMVSDEIHCDLILDPGANHYSALRLPEPYSSRTITLLSPSKTWNIAGLGYAYAVIPNDTLRRRFASSRGHTLAEINTLSYYAAEAAYKDGEPWRLELIHYLRSNRDFLVDYINSECPGLEAETNEATYLAWIDASKTGLEKPADHFEKKAKLFLSEGSHFGMKNHFRFNFACPRSRMIEGLEKIKKAL